MPHRIDAVMAHIQEIEARLNAFVNPAPPPPAPAPTGGSAVRPFNVIAAEANGRVGLRSLGAGPFAPDIEALVNKYSAQNGLSPVLVRALIQQESGGNPRARSVVGAQGLMQLMPETAQGYGVRDAFDPEQNIAAGTRHLAGLLREFNGDVSLALAAYNAGSAAVRKYNGIPPYDETQQYVRRIQAMLGPAR